MPRHSIVTIIIHWTTALLVVAAWFTAVGGPRARDDPSYLHFWIGFAVLLLVIPRMVARGLGAVPRLEDPQGAWLSIAAKIGHTVLYIVLVALPLSGWYAASRLGIHLRIFGISLPSLAPSAQGPPGEIAELHEQGGTIILYLAGIHAILAFWHQLVLRDGTLTRMLPSRFVSQGPARQDRTLLE